MKVYIASSWKNQHAVVMLTEKLRAEGCEVSSFVENNYGEWDKTKLAVPQNFDDWVWSDAGKSAFEYDTGGATESDLVIYISPSGIDAWAEVGAAWARGVPIIGLVSKGEQSGLMRRMVTWVERVEDVMFQARNLKGALDERRAAFAAREGK